MATRKGRRPAIIGAFATRPRLLIAFASGIAVGAALKLAAGVPLIDALVGGWITVCLAFAGLMLPHIAKRTPAQMRQMAARYDEGRVVILVLVATAAAMSMAGAAGELLAAKAAHDDNNTLGEGLHAAVAFLTVAASWLFVQLNFALHYAHNFYDRQLDGTGDVGGLQFPGRQLPDYWDFLHFSVIIGVAAQTADIQITSKSLRRLNTAHAAFAFTFNTIVVALTINLLAGLFE